MFLLLSLIIYTNSLMELKLFQQYACFVRHDFISLLNDPFLDLKDIMPKYFHIWINKLHAALIPWKSLVFINCTVCFKAFKVECKKAKKGIASKVTLFDFTGNDFSSLATQPKHLSIVERKWYGENTRYRAEVRLKKHRRQSPEKKLVYYREFIAVFKNGFLDRCTGHISALKSKHL